MCCVPVRDEYGRALVSCLEEQEVASNVTDQCFASLGRSVAHATMLSH